MKDGKDFFNLKDRVVLVTGGSGGLGRGFCENPAGFCGEGAPIAGKKVEGAQEKAGIV